MYKILGKHRSSSDTYKIFEAGDDAYSLESASLSLECGKAGELTFSMPDDNASKSSVIFPSDEIMVYRDDVEIWRGRPITNEQDFNLTGTVTCEGILSYLYDTFFAPYDFSGSPTDLLSSIIASHNAQVDSSKQFSLGNVTVKDKNDYITRSGSDYDRCLNVISDKLVDGLGGYIRVRIEDDVRYIDWLESYGTTASQEIKLGSNILDIAQDVEYSEMVTAILPLGAQDEETGQYLTVESVNDGSLYVQDASLVSEHGFVCDCVIWKDVTIAENLLTKAQTYLAQAVSPVESVTVKAIDLGLTSDEIEYINLGDSVSVISTPHGINSWMELTSLKLNLIDPSKDSLTFGGSNSSLTNKSASTSRKIASDLSAQGVTIRKINALYVTTDYLEANYINANQLEVIQANIESAVVKDLDAKYITAEEVDAKYSKILSLDVDVEGVHTLYVGQEAVDYIVSHYADITLANIDTANMDKAKVAQLLAGVALITDATIVDGHVTGALDSVTLNADNITAGTLVAERILLKGKTESGNSILYALNYDPEKQEVSSETLDGDILTERTVTADKLVANSITANEIASGAITSDKIEANAITSEKIAAGAITTDRINFGTDETLTEFLNNVTTQVSTIKSDVGDINLVVDRQVDKTYISSGTYSEKSLEDYVTDTIPTLANYPCDDTSLDFYIWDLCGSETVNATEIANDNNFEAHLNEITKVVDSDGVKTYYQFSFDSESNEYYWRKMTAEEIEALADKTSKISISDDGITLTSINEDESSSATLTKDGFVFDKIYCC